MSVWAGTNGHLLTLQYTTYVRMECNIVVIVVSVVHNSLTHEGKLPINPHCPLTFQYCTDHRVSIYKQTRIGTRAHEIAATQINLARCVFNHEMHMNTLECSLVIYP